MYLGKRRSLELIRLYGADRVLYGTDFPMWNAEEELQRMNDLGLSQEEMKLIFGENARRILQEL